MCGFDTARDGNTRSLFLYSGDTYYHGNTADLEIEQAYLEEAAGREAKKARLKALAAADFMLDRDDDTQNNRASSQTEKKNRRRTPH